MGLPQGLPETREIREIRETREIREEAWCGEGEGQTGSWYQGEDSYKVTAL